MLLVDGRPTVQFSSLEEAKTYVLNQDMTCNYHAELPSAPQPAQVWQFDFDLDDWVFQN